MAQISYIRNVAKQAVEYATIIDTLKKQAELNPSKEIFIFYSIDGERESITLSGLFQESQKFAGVLSSMGIKKGDKVIMRLYNSIEWLVIGFGLMAIGAIPVGSYIVRKDVSDLNYIINKTNAVAIFFSSHDSSIHNGIKRLMAQHSPTIKYAVSVNTDEDDGVLLSYRKLVRTNVKERPVPDAWLDPDDIAVIMRSSGTTGRPKLVSHSHLNFQKYFTNFSALSTKMYSNAEFSWMGGSPISTVLNGLTRVTVTGNQSPVTPEKHLHFIEKESCGIIALTSNVLNSIVKNRLHLPSCVDTVALGGAPIKKQCQLLLDDVTTLLCAYGNLEVGFVSSVQIKKGMILNDNTSGYPEPGVEVKVTDDNGKVVKLGEKGKIFVRNEKWFLGYYGDEEMTKRSMTPSNWYDTGDTGYISESGQLFVIGREGECVTRGTVTNHVTEIEIVIKELQIPQIEDVVIVPVPDEILYEEICACIILKQGHSLTRDDVLQLFDDAIQAQSYKPKYVVFMDSFPVNINGKLDRKITAEHAVKTLFESI